MTNALSPKMQTVFFELQGGPKSTLDLLLALWGTGQGPDWEENDLRGMIANMNKRLRVRGLKIVSEQPPAGDEAKRKHEKTGRKPGRRSVYRLIGVTPSETLPHKQIDPWGVAVD